MKGTSSQFERFPPYKLSPFHSRDSFFLVLFSFVFLTFVLFCFLAVSTKKTLICGGDVSCFWDYLVFMGVNYAPLARFLELLRVDPRDTVSL